MSLKSAVAACRPPNKQHVKSDVSAKQHEQKHLHPEPSMPLLVLGESLLKQYQQAMMLPAGKELKSFFETEKDFQIFSEKIKKHTGIDASLFQNLKPLILLSLIAQKSMECENTSSYEMNLLEMSAEKKLPVEGLETSLAQMKIFDDMKDEEIRGILLEGLEDMEQDQKLQNQMIEAYKNQNIDALHDLILSSKELQNKEEALLTNRNKDWVIKLPKIMAEKPCFIAVGAGQSNA